MENRLIHLKQVQIELEKKLKIIDLHRPQHEQNALEQCINEQEKWSRILNEDVQVDADGDVCMSCSG